MTDEKDEAEPSGASGGYPAVVRRFVILGGSSYYARGGFNDFISSHETLDEAIKAAEILAALKGMDSVEWWHVWDCSTNCVVAKSRYQAYGTDDRWPTLDEWRVG